LRGANFFADRTTSPQSTHFKTPQLTIQQRLRHGKQFLHKMFPIPRKIFEAVRRAGKFPGKPAARRPLEQGLSGKHGIKRRSRQTVFPTFGWGRFLLEIRCENCPQQISVLTSRAFVGIIIFLVPARK
jgi:hypothetical protein